MKIEFNRQMVIEGHLQYLLRLQEEKIEKLSRSVRAYKGWKTKRKK